MYKVFNARGFSTTRPTANKYARLESLEAGASIALEALLDSEGSNTELPAAGPEESKELLKSARVCLIEITNLFIAWSREDEMYMFVSTSLSPFLTNNFDIRCNDEG